MPADFETVLLSGDLLKVSFVPAIGGKIVSLYDQIAEREWLWTDQTRPLRRPVPGGQFADYDISGFDECFPTIGACEYPDPPYSGRPLPDHGELWATSWSCTANRDTVAMSATGRVLPYRLTRAARIEGRTLRLDYELVNRGTARLRYHWSAHPLFAVAPGMRIELPERPRLIKEFGLGGMVGADDPLGRQGYLAEYQWPMARSAAGGAADLRLLTFPRPPATYKVYAVDLTVGWARLVDPMRAEGLEIRWPLEHIPYLGVCVNMAAWPSIGQPGRWVALEPCTATCDRLDLAVARGECATIEGSDRARWWLEVELLRSVARC